MTVVPDGVVGTLKPENGQEHGRTTVTPRALNRVASAVTADIFGIPPGAVHVDLSDQDGLLALTIRTPVRVIPLTLTQQPAVVTETSEETLLQLVTDAQTTIRDRVAALTGAVVVHVTVRVSGIETEEGRRLT